MKNVSFYAPKRNAKADSIAELEKDLTLINMLMHVSNRRVRTKLITLQFKTQQTIREKKERQDAGEEEEEPTSFDELAIFLSTLAMLKDRPHVWNQVVVEVQRLQKEQAESTAAATEESSVWDFFGSATKKPQHANANETYQWQPETRRTSEDRWQDVERIDEVLDNTVPEKSAAHHMLTQLKKKCATEARALQRVEAHHHHMTITTTATPMDNNNTALDTSLSKLESAY